MKQFKSLADSKNRRDNKRHVEHVYKLPELGWHNIEFLNDNETIAVGYNRIVYGDHGPYIEFNENNIYWDAFPNRNEKGASIAYYNEYYTTDKVVKLYAQQKSVSDQPNPPSGPYSAPHNRFQGYADYIV